MKYFILKQVALQQLICIICGFLFVVSECVLLFLPPPLLSPLPPPPLPFPPLPPPDMGVTQGLRPPIMKVSTMCTGGHMRGQCRHGGGVRYLA